MPKFEIQLESGPNTPLFQRGRTAADAVSRVLPAPDKVEVDETPDDRGWMAVRLDGKAIGRIRDHAARMRFRRD